MERFMRIGEVAKVFGIAKSTAWLWVKEGHLPVGHKIGPRVTVWKESEILAYMMEVAA